MSHVYVLHAQVLATDPLGLRPILSCLLLSPPERGHVLLDALATLLAMPHLTRAGQQKLAASASHIHGAATATRRAASTSGIHSTSPHAHHGWADLPGNLATLGGSVAAAHTHGFGWGHGSVPLGSGFGAGGGSGGSGGGSGGGGTTHDLVSHYVVVTLHVLMQCGLVQVLEAAAAADDLAICSRAADLLRELLILSASDALLPPPMRLKLHQLSHLTNRAIALRTRTAAGHGSTARVGRASSDAVDGSATAHPIAHAAAPHQMALAHGPRPTAPHPMALVHKSLVTSVGAAGGAAPDADEAKEAHALSQMLGTVALTPMPPLSVRVGAHGGGGGGVHGRAEWELAGGGAGLRGAPAAALAKDRMVEVARRRIEMLWQEEGRAIDEPTFSQQLRETAVLATKVYSDWDWRCDRPPHACGHLRVLTRPS